MLKNHIFVIREKYPGVMLCQLKWFCKFRYQAKTSPDLAKIKF